ncbi:unnamed protein product, partial [Amoebophrya sp. A25]
PVAAKVVKAPLSPAVFQSQRHRESAAVMLNNSGGWKMNFSSSSEAEGEAEGNGKD